MASIKRQKRSIGSHIILAAWSLVILFPILMMVLNSFQETWTFINYAKVLINGNFLIYFRNSFVVGIISLALLLITGSLAAFAFANNLLSRFSQGLYFFLIAGMILPIRIASIKILELIRFLGLANTIWPLIPVYIAMSLPITVFILTLFIRQIPCELTEAGIIDGASRFVIFTRIILPQLKPALVTTAIYNMIIFWNDFWFPLVFISNDKAMTLPLGLTRLFDQSETAWPIVMAGMTFSAAPVIILYLLVSKQFISSLMAGLTAGATKD